MYRTSTETHPIPAEVAALPCPPWCDDCTPWHYTASESEPWQRIHSHKVGSWTIDSAESVCEDGTCHTVDVPEVWTSARVFTGATEVADAVEELMSVARLLIAEERAAVQSGPTFKPVRS